MNLADIPVLDPDSPRGRQAANDLSEVLGDVVARLIAEGQPLPDCLRSTAA